MKNEHISHPAAGCTKAQVAAFERIATGDDTMINPRTAAALVEKGIIEEMNMILRGLPTVTVKRYSVPVSVHMQWCLWCSLNVPEPGEVE